MELKILTFPDPILKKIAQPVKELGPEIIKLALDMLATMYKAPGIGLAANQVGVLKRIIVVDTSRSVGAEEKIPETLEELLKHPSAKVYVNPEITESSSQMKDCEEGCLSVPGFVEVVRRPEKVKLKATLLDGSSVETWLENLDAVCVQHEIDHLNGRLFIDRLSSLKREFIKKKISKEL